MRARALAACLALLLTAGLTTAAHAQLGDVGEDTLDTDATPVAKESVKWEWWAGARYRGAPKPSNVPQGSATPFELDFFDVAFHDLDTGLAGGAICRDPVPKGASPDEARAHTAQCERVPALFRYSVDEAGAASWSPLDLGASTQRRGYVGAIAWLDSDTALAVGGDGCYPRREEPCPDGDTPPDPAGRAPAGDPAGMARAWLYEAGSLRELTDLPEGMRGLSALSTHSGGAFAGALRQIWRYENGAFVTGWSGDSSAPQEVRYPELFQFRVRDIRGARAATAGCCRTDPLQSAGPRLLTFDGTTWIVGRRSSDFSNATGALDDQSKSEPLGDPLPGAFDSVEGAVESSRNSINETLLNLWRNRIESFVWDSGVRPLADRCGDPGPGNSPVRPLLSCTWQGEGNVLGVNPLPEGLDDTLGPYPIDLPNNLLDDPRNPDEGSVLGPFGLGSPPDLGPAPELPDPPGTSGVRDPANDAYGNAFAQLYGATKFLNGYAIDGHSVNTQTQAQAPDSYYALFSGGTAASPGGPPPGPGQDEPGSVISNGPSLLLTSARLVSADQTPLAGGVEAVGMLRSSGQGVLVGAAERDPHRVNDSLLGNPQGFRADEEAHGCKIQDPTKAVASGIEQPECDTNAQRFLDQQRSLRLFKLDSYALNAIEVVEGAGWAVGDHGAIHSRQPPPPPPPQPPQPPARAGAKLESEPVSSEAFEEHRPAVTDESGPVPALAPGVNPAEPGFYESQAPGGRGVIEIVMSRDGSRGWAFADDGPPYRYDGARWRQCDLELCPTGIVAASRVPLERDTDPTNDEEFEVVALAAGGGVYRYRERRWLWDEEAILDNGSPVRGDDVAFTAPNDGWVAASANVITNLGWGYLLHFDGERWVDCFREPQACDAFDRRIKVRFPQGKAGGGWIGLATAGERVYVFAIREAIPACINTSTACPTEPYPVILYHDASEPCEKVGDPGCWRGGDDDTDPDTEDPDPTDKQLYNPADGGWDPGCDPSAMPAPGQCAATGKRTDQGWIFSLSVAQEADGSHQGWAVGTFGGLEAESAGAVMMRLAEGGWSPWGVRDAANDYLRFDTRVRPEQLLSFPSEAGRLNAFLLASFRVGTTIVGSGAGGRPPALAFDRQRGRWEAIPTPWSATTPNLRLMHTLGNAGTLAPDGQGGFWAGVTDQENFTFSFQHYTDRAPQEVFEETPDPAGDAQITAFAASADGTVWLGDEDGFVYRYDRLAGWSRKLQIPGWDPKQATNPTAISAIAVGPDGEGIAVGRGGRIATLGDKVGLDPAATVSCGTQDGVPPCGTAKDLFAAAVAPDGSAIIIGQERTLLWRPPNGEFRLIEAPPVPLPASTVMEMPRPDHAYLLTEGTRIVRGEMSAPGRWSWEIEVGNAEGKPDPLTDSGTSQGNGAKVYRSIADIAVDASGHGYAVGTGGLLLERTDDGDQPWRRVASGYSNNLQRIALPAGGGEGALIGGEGGLILTLVGDQLQVARHADPFDPLAGKIAELALTPGYGVGEVEAWALRQGFRVEAFTDVGRPDALLHYPADAADPRLDPSRGLAALSDVPAPTPGETAFAAFGKQDCDGARTRGVSGLLGTFAVRDTCGPPDGSNVTADLINRRIREELSAPDAGETQPQFAVFTGDAVDMPGGRAAAEGTLPFFHFSWQLRTPLDIDLKHRRWVELVARPLAERGIATFGAIGGQDLARNAEECSPPFTDIFFGGCINPRQAGGEQLGAEQGLNLPWRAAMARTPAPWEGSQEAGGLRFEPLQAGVLSQQEPNGDTPDPGHLSLTVPSGESLTTPSGDGAQARREPYPLGAGDTHYSVDAYRGSEKVARIVVVDTSMRSIAASDPMQHPHEAGGQLRWLEEMLCFEGSPEDTDGDVHDCTREEGQQAIVVSNTPTYSYGPISPEELQTDAAVFESVLLKNQVNVVVSGRLGWNGRYWALAPGVHAPCPGESYRPDSETPSLAQPEVCGAGPGEEADPSQITDQLPEQAQDATGLASRGALPFVVSSTAGGRFNVRADRGGLATADAGFWRGYSIVRLHPSGDPSKTIVEQRPILDWVGLQAREQELEPRAEVDVRGYARETFGMDTLPRYYDIPDHEGITHRYHLLAVDPKKPWVPQPSSEGPCAPYLCLPERIGTIDPDTGKVRAGNGKYPDTFALATLSVGQHVAVQPLVFTRSPSFVLSAFAQPPEVPAPGASVANAPTAPPPPSAPKPPTPQVNTPEPPLPPAVPPIAATQPPEPQPPAPPAPPPPTDQPSPLNLTLAPPGITVATPTAVIQPPTPPVNPAPPGGARREARQRQAATQKSGADSSESETQHDVDLAQGPSKPEGSGYTRHESSFTRTERSRPAPSFTTLSGRDPASGGSAGPLYIGGITLLALAAALGWTTARPTPRRRPPEAPAPGWSQVRGSR